MSHMQQALALYAVPFQIQLARVTIVTESHRFLKYSSHLTQGIVPEIHSPLNVRKNME